ncbi:hypothetical protein [Lactobacillus panisapium]|uniref:hypothetical protein n=1 Tax=Lactobacillus panisapium TaxID=2012495 RepID=UPI002265B610|nr:hypothetical protein [Lactobacillus panisapium]
MDAISGATHSVNGLIDAIGKVIQRAGGTLHEHQTEIQSKNLSTNVRQTNLKNIRSRYSSW